MQNKMVDYWQIVTPSNRRAFNAPRRAPPSGGDDSSVGAGYQHYSNDYNWYTKVVSGDSGRASEYRTVDGMDRDVFIARSLDTVAEEMSTKDETDSPFVIDWQTADNVEIRESTIITVKSALREWIKRQDLENRVFRISRMVVKYGDCFFRRDSVSRKWRYINPSNIVGIEIDEMGDIVAYHINNPDEVKNNSVLKNAAEPVDASEIVHFSLSDAMASDAPFGESILRPVIKTYRQMALLESALIIYRVVRAPERRVFYLDTGNMVPQKQKAYMESVKTEIKQRRVVSGQNSDDIDGVYNPASMGEDFFFATTANGRGSRVETLPGGTGLGDQDDLKYFKDKLLVGLRVPTSYMRGSAEGGATYNDGKVGIAFIEELRFANFVKRLQNKVERVFDDEFKLYLDRSNIVVDTTVFKLRLPDPQNFALYRQAAIAGELFNAFNSAEQVKYLSKRFILKRFLGMTEEDIQLNEAMLRQERGILDDETSLRRMYDPAYYDNLEPVKLDNATDETGGDDAEVDAGDTGLFGGDEPPPDMGGDVGGDAPPDAEPAPEPDALTAEKPPRP